MDMEKATALLLSIIMLLMTPAAASNENAGDSWIHRIFQLVSQKESEEISFAITRASVPLRNAPNLMAKASARVDGGAYVQVLQTKTTGGVQWARIRSGNAEGWVKLSLLTIVESYITPENTATTKEAFNLYASPSQNSTVVTKLDQGESLQMIQTEYYASIRWAFVDAPSKGVSGWIPCEVLELPQAWQEGSSIPGYARMGVINTSRLNIRLGPGTNNLRIGSYGYGQRIGVLEIQGEWGRTNRGWIYLPYTYLDGNLGNHPMVGNVATTQLNVRTGPGTGYRAIGSLHEGDRVLVLEQFTIGSLVWGYTRAGWICMNYVQPDYIPGTTTPIYGYGYVAQNEALYGGAGTSYPVVGTVPAKSLIPIWSVVSAEGISWGQTPNGWVNMAHVNMTEVYKHLNPPPKPVEPDPGVPCTGLTAEPIGALTSAGQTWQLKVTVSPVNTTDTLSYASRNPAVVTVDNKGLVTAVGEGTTSIVIACGNQQIEVAATVKFPPAAVPCTGLTTDPMQEFTAAGQTQQLNVTVSPANTTDTVTYTSNDPSVVTVDGNGVVTAAGEGSTSIVIACGNQQIEVAATVKFPPVNVPCTALTADPTEVLFTAAGETQQLKVTASPENTTDTLTYTSNDSTVVTVDDKGLVTAVGEGSTSIVVTCGSQQIEVPVTVKAPTVPCTGLTADSTVELTTGQTWTLTVTVSPTDTTDTVAFSSSNPAIAAVDGNGLVTAVGEGSTSIVVTCGSQQVEVPVTVKAPTVPCTGLTADSTVELTTGQTWTLTVTVSPTDTTDTVAFSSSNPAIAAVDGNGLVTAVGEGTASIVVTCGSQQVEVPVTVKAPTVPCTGLTVEPMEVSFTAAGQTQQLNVTVSPTDTTDTISYASNDPAVVTVDGNGLVTAVGEGSTSIVITCGGQQTNVTAAVNFPDPPVEPEPLIEPEAPAEPETPPEPVGVIDLNLELTAVNTVELTVGQTRRLKITVSPADNSDMLTFASNNPAIVTVDGNGLITAVGEGSTVIVIACSEKQIEVPVVVTVQ